jgi:hypothetical protein
MIQIGCDTRLVHHVFETFTLKLSLEAFITHDHERLESSHAMITFVLKFTIA